VDGSTLLQALALLLLIEGLLPCISPSRWRRMFEQLLGLSNGQIRFFGLSSMVIGLALLAVLAWIQA
jgi:uncharacterized protein